MQHQALRSSHEALSISLDTLHDFEGIRSHNLTKLLRLSPNIYNREITSLIGSFSREELHRPRTFSPNHTTATNTVE